MYSIMEMGEETVQDYIDRNMNDYQNEFISKKFLTFQFYQIY